MPALRWTFGLLLLGCVASSAAAQNPPRDLRIVEQTIELAWLADPITFPYELRAFLRNGVMEVHGVVSDVTVRKQALNIAKLHHTKPVDHTDLKPGKERGYVPLPAERVVATAKAAIARAYPQLAATITVQCRDGVVTLAGSASTFAEKMAAGEVMRRVPGCLRVENTVQIVSAVETPLPPVLPQVQPAIFNTRPNNELFPQPIANAATDQMREAIAKLCPQAANLTVAQTGPRRFLIHFVAPTKGAASQMATVILNRAEWQHFRLDLDVDANVTRP